MAFVGMDVDQVSSIGSQLQGQADQLQTMIGQIESLIGQAMSAWQGGDADQFMDWWQTKHKPALTDAQTAIHGLGQSAMNNAEEQRTTSSR